MKKVLALALGMLLIPFTAFGMQTMDEAAMDSVTGKGGVAISVSNVGIYSSGETVWYQGGTEGAGSAWVGITAGDEVTLIDPYGLGMETDEQEINDFAQDVIGGTEDTLFADSPLMIQTADEIAFLGDSPGVLITLGTLDIRTYQGENVTEFGIGISEDTAAPEAFGDGLTYGRMSATDGRTVILGGQIGIAPAGPFTE